MLTVVVEEESTTKGTTSVVATYREFLEVPMKRRIANGVVAITLVLASFHFLANTKTLHRVASTFILLILFEMLRRALPIDKTHRVYVQRIEIFPKVGVQVSTATYFTTFHRAAASSSSSSSSLPHRESEEEREALGIVEREGGESRTVLAPHAPARFYPADEILSAAIVEAFYRCRVVTHLTLALRNGGSAVLLRGARRRGSDYREAIFKLFELLDANLELCADEL